MIKYFKILSLSKPINILPKHFLLNRSIYQMCSTPIPKNIYKPLLPLTQPYNLIYLNSQYGIKRQSKIKQPFLLLFAPSLILINNLLTSWTTFNTFLFLIAVAFSFGIKVFHFMKLFNNIHSLHIDPQIKYMYIGLQKTDISQKFLKEYLVSIQQKKDLITKYTTIEIKQTIAISDNISIVKIPIQNITFEIQLQNITKQSLQNDKQQLSARQVLKKYSRQQRGIIVSFKNITSNFSKYIQLQKQKQFPWTFNILDSINNKKNDDYLLALVLGYKIDISDNVMSGENKEKKDEKESHENKEDGINKWEKENQKMEDKKKDM